MLGFVTSLLVPSALCIVEQMGLGKLVGTEPLTGGVTSVVLRLSFERGSLVYKESDHAQPGMYACEADGLRALRDAGFRAPEVFSFGEDHILIEDLGPQKEALEADWVRFAQAVARLHLVSAPRFGYKQPNYLGTMLMDNGWREDGNRFFAETRILQLLEKPKACEHLTAKDRRIVERVAARINDFPKYPPALNHGDLWLGNMLFAGDEPALIDPAVHFGLAEADLALLPGFPQITDSFYDAYREINPLEPGWRERLDLLSLRDPLCMVAEYGETHDSVTRLRDLLKRLA
jgi:fructosamine-3-kinase